jgi:hypothetical protein
MPVNGQKICSKCGISRSVNEFWKDKDRKDGLYSWCIPCTKTYKRTKKYFRTKEQTREQHLKRTYGLTLEQYDEMFESQNGVCAICGGVNINGKRLCVDHNHKTNKVRGLLCHSCNFFIGNSKESIIILRSAINYLGDDNECK